MKDLVVFVEPLNPSHTRVLMEERSKENALTLAVVKNENDESNDVSEETNKDCSIGIDIKKENIMETFTE